MGKGSRNRGGRKSRPGSAAGTDYPFEVDDRTRRKLGEQGMAYLAENLWPKDCQTCGWTLGEEPPTVFVQDIVVFAQASLHHRRCQPAEWSDSTMVQMTKAELLSYDVLAFLLPGEVTSADGARRERQDRPVFYVNPTLESVTLTKTAEGWTGGLPNALQHAGLRPATEPFQPTTGATAKLGIGDVTVTVPSTSGHWSCGINVPFREAIEDTGGLLLAVTTAAVPSRMQRAGEFISLLGTDKMSLAWVNLDRTQD